MWQGGGRGGKIGARGDGGMQRVGVIMSGRAHFSDFNFQFSIFFAYICKLF